MKHRTVTAELALSTTSCLYRRRFQSDVDGDQEFILEFLVAWSFIMNSSSSCRTRQILSVVIN